MTGAMFLYTSQILPSLGDMQTVHRDFVAIVCNAEVVNWFYCILTEIRNEFLDLIA